MRNSKLARTACKRNPQALKFAKTLQDDKIVVMECVLRDGSCLAFASFAIRSNPEFIRCARRTKKRVAAVPLSHPNSSWCNKLTNRNRTQALQVNS